MEPNGGAENPPVKSGTKTTEFWMALAPIAIGLVDGSKEDPETKKLMIICATAIGAVYIVCRTLIKWKSCP